MARDRKRALIVACGATYAFYCLATMPGGPITAPDSDTYLAFSPIVPSGYPAFLRVVGARGAMILQPMIFSAALAWLGVEALVTTSSLALAAAVMAAAIAIPGLTAYHASILTESLFMSAVIGFLASTIRFVRAPSSASAAAAATIAGLACTLRSTGYAFFPVPIVMVLLERHRLTTNRRAILLAATLPLLTLAAGERIAASARHGDRLLSLMGRHLFAKAALIDAPAPARPPADPVDPLRAQLEAELDVAFAPIRAFIDRASGKTRVVLTLYYETCLQGACVAELGESRAAYEDSRLAGALALAARERIARAPLNFAKLVATDYASLWIAYKQRHPDTAPVLDALIASSRPLPFEREAFRLTPGDAAPFHANSFVRFLQPIIVAIGCLTGVLSLVGLAAVAGRPLPPTLAIACLASLAAHAALLFSAAFAAGIARFIVAVWPAVTTAVIFAAAPLFRFAVRPPRSVGLSHTGGR